MNATPRLLARYADSRRWPAAPPSREFAVSLQDRRETRATNGATPRRTSGIRRRHGGAASESRPRPEPNRTDDALSFLNRDVLVRVECGKVLDLAIWPRHSKRGDRAGGSQPERHRQLT